MQQFLWNDAHADSYQLVIGDAPGGTTYGVFPPAGTTATTIVVTGLPTDGRTIYVKLWSRNGSTWLARSFSFVTGP